MYKISTYLFVLVLLCSLSTYAQAPRRVLFQHFSQASCEPCAAQNPSFENGVLFPDSNALHHFVVHTSWPGYDPMYLLNKGVSDSLVSYYTVSGVPDIIMDGNQKSGSPTLYSTADVVSENAKTSPIKITVQLKKNGTADTALVTITSVGPLSKTGNYRLRTAVIERWVHYTSAPGTNGEKDFPNVLRMMLHGAIGDSLAVPALGKSITYTYPFTKNAAWVDSQIAVVAYVQDDNNKFVVNSSANFDRPNNGLLFTPNKWVSNVASSSPYSFNCGVGNSGAAAEMYKLVLTKTHPSNWSCNFKVGGSTYTDSVTLTLPADSIENVLINVTPGSTPYVGSYTLTMTSVTNPYNPPMQCNLNVISGITDLLVNNSAGIGDGSTKGDASNWMTTYMTGLQTTGSKTLGFTNEQVLNRAILDSAMNGVGYIYYNVGWTFPAITDDKIPQLKAFLNNGGRMYIGGQDVAWSTFASTSNYATAAGQSFIRGYFGVDFVSDGDTTDKTVNAVNGEIFNPTPAVKIINYYGNGSNGPYVYPDNISKFGAGIPIFNYNKTSTAIAGMRKSNGVYKTVYFAPGIEMLADTAAQNTIMRITYGWFHGIISNIQFDYLSKNLLKAYPIPADKYLTVEMPDNFTGSMEVYNLLGQKIYAGKINGEQTITIPSESWTPGAYLCQMSNGLSLKVVVTH